MPRQTLHELGLKHGTNKSYRHNFLVFYEQYLDSRRYSPINLLELGIGKVAGSAKMWDAYFVNPSAKFTVVDRDAERLAGGIKTKRWRTVEMNVKDSKGLNEMAETCGPDGFDFIIDDCVHSPMIQKKTFRTLWPHVKPGGIYFMEDIGRSYMHGPCMNADKRVKYGVDYYLDQLLHKMVPHPEDRTWETDIAYMHFYPHVVIIGKTDDNTTE